MFEQAFKNIDDILRKEAGVVFRQVIQASVVLSQRRTEAIGGSPSCQRLTTVKR